MGSRSVTASVSPSMALAEIVGQRPASRVEIFTKLLRYIDAHGLRDAGDSQLVLCDTKLRAAFGLKSLTVSELERRIGEHLV